VQALTNAIERRYPGVSSGHEHETLVRVNGFSPIKNPTNVGVNGQQIKLTSIVSVWKRNDLVFRNIPISISASPGLPDMNNLTHPREEPTASQSKPKVIWLFTHRIQYFTNLLDELEAKGQVENLAVYAINTASLVDRGFQKTICWDNRPVAAFREIVLKPERKSQGLVFWTSYCSQLRQLLSEESPDVVMINGYNAAISWQGFMWCVSRTVPFGLRGDGDTLRKRVWWKRLFRQAVVGPLASRASIVFHQGAENMKFWRTNGVRPDRMVWVPCVSDTSLFQPGAFPSEEERAEFRLAHGTTPMDVVFICSGKLEPRKRQEDILYAAAKAEAPRAKFWFLGSGPDSEKLKRMAASLGISDRCVWLGFQNQTSMPKCLAAADVLVHPSELDPWPYAVLEGARLGLPLLLSSLVGSTPDWLATPAAALSFPCGNPDALAAAIEKLEADEPLRKALASAAIAHASKHTEAHFAEIVESAVRRITSPRKNAVDSDPCLRASP
jgi:glycosyltransferase involved in cell wall biosynthesis